MRVVAVQRPPAGMGPCTPLLLRRVSTTFLGSVRFGRVPEEMDVNQAQVKREVNSA